MGYEKNVTTCHSTQLTRTLHWNVSDSAQRSVMSRWRCPNSV